VNNDRVEPDQILEPHRNATLKRASAEQHLALVHDTTTFEFDSTCAAKDIGYLSTGRAGFLGHFTMAVAVSSPVPDPLGMVGWHLWHRDRKPAGHGKSKTRKLDGGTLARKKNREADRWQNQALRTSELFDETTSLTHVMDREADSFSIFSSLVRAEQDFVIRMTQRHRRAQAADDMDKLGWSAMNDVVASATVRTTVEASAGRRRHRSRKGGPRTRSAFPQRSERPATLNVSAFRVTIPRPRYLKEHPETLTLNVVHVFEPSPPEDDASIEWILVTTHAVETEDDLHLVIDLYRRRWLIEEYFKALKTGCAYKERRFESRDALYNMLAVTMPIAWRLLRLRACSRQPEPSPADQEFDALELQVLRQFSSVKLPDQPSIRDALMATAALGGHLKSNGDPGWLVIWRGYEHLQTLATGWRAAIAQAAESEM
jgi:hypothetical protein